MGVLTVGLTGGLASGKSTVGRLMEELGCVVSDADRIVAELYQPGGRGAEEVRRLFSPELLDTDGGVDKEKLADRVFNDPEDRRRLEAAIHPLVGEAYAALLAGSEGIVVFEAPLLVETGGADRYQVLVTVEADPGLRIERAIARGIDPESAKARLRAQTDTETRTARADYVLRNDGSVEELEAQVADLVSELRTRLDRGEHRP